MSESQEEERCYEVAVAWHSVVYGLQVGEVWAESEEEAREKVKEDPWRHVGTVWPDDYDDWDGPQMDHIEWCG